jgi:hypothetical protein
MRKLILLILLLFSVTALAHEKHAQTKPMQSAPVNQTKPAAPTTVAPENEDLEEEDEGEMPGFKEALLTATGICLGLGFLISLQSAEC